MKNAIAVILLVSLLLALGGCAGDTEPLPSEQPSVAEATEKTPAPTYDGELPADLFGIFDEESYENAFFGVKYLRDGNWTFYTSQELASVNGGAGETPAETLRRVGYVYDMYARSGQETLGFTVAIPSVQYGKAMTEAEYAQATKDASARDYAGADYDVVSGEIGTAQYGGAEHPCFYLTVAANGMVFYTAQLFMQRGDFMGIVYVSAESEEGRTSLLSSF